MIRKLIFPEKKRKNNLVQVVRGVRMSVPAVRDYLKQFDLDGKVEDYAVP